MSGLMTVYYAGLLPATFLMIARAVWLRDRDRESLRVLAPLCLIVAVTWPLSLPVGVIVRVSERLHLDGWIDRYLDWLERTLGKGDGDA